MNLTHAQIVLDADDYNGINAGPDTEELLRLLCRLTEAARKVAGTAEHPVRVRVVISEVIPGKEDG